MWDVYSKEPCFWTETKFFWECEDFAGNPETFEIFCEIQIKLKLRKAWEFLGTSAKNVG